MLKIVIKFSETLYSSSVEFLYFNKPIFESYMPFIEPLPYILFKKCKTLPRSSFVPKWTV